MKIAQTMTELIGNTPLLRLNGYTAEKRLNATILAKIEYFNPCGSAKDRIALAMIAAAEAEGRLTAGGTVIEPTSGNTGIALAAVAATRGYKAVIVMPDSMSRERVSIIKAYGAEVVLTDGKLGMSGAIAKARELEKTIVGAVIAGQFDNPANPKAHYDTTGPEIWRDTDGKIDIFVACVGTGGTLSGAGKFLKEQNGDIKIIAVEPSASPVLSGGKAGAHKIQGIGAGFVPETLDTSIYDEIVTVPDADAFAAAKLVGRTDGVLVGISSGAALYAAEQIAKRPENANKNIVTVFPDSADRYYSTPLFE